MTSSSLMKIFVAAFLLLAATAAMADTTVVDVGGRKVRVRSEGVGPSIVFEGGFSETLDAWRDVIPEVAKFAHAFAYDRAGMGGSEPAAADRTLKNIATELHEVLQHEKVAWPYLFVAHSYGGPIVRTFYALYPAEVRGIVFVDPMSEQIINNDEKRSEHLAQQEATLKNAPAGILAEWSYLKSQALAHHPDLEKIASKAPDVPMALLIATIARPDVWRQGLIDQYGAWVMARQDSLLVVTPNSSHSIQRDEPALVVSAVRSLLYPNPLAALTDAMTRGGVDAVIHRFRDQLAIYPKVAMTPTLLNTIGYGFLRQKRVADAITIFALNVATFPNDGNAYDSLGEAYAANGDRAAALQNYRKSLDLDPSNEGAKKAIATLEAPADTPAPH